MDLQVKCNAMSNDGKGICQIEDKVAFIENILTDEEATVTIEKSKGKLLYGKVKEIKKASLDRVVPLCPYFQQCGGCQLQHLKYQQQLVFKKEQIKRAFKKIANLDVDVKEVIGMENPCKYRNKIELFVYEGKFGFKKEQSDQIVAIDQCLIADEKINKIMLELKKVVAKNILDLDKIIIKSSFSKQQTMVILIFQSNKILKDKEMQEQIKNTLKDVTTIVINVTSKKRVRMSKLNLIIKGKGYIEDHLLGKTFLISPNSFYQVNHLQTEKLYQKALELANLTTDDQVLDTYCGIGTIGIIASDYVSKVNGVEIEKSAIEDAKENAKINNCNNANFYCNDTAKFIKNYKIKENVIFIDPPRSGCDKIFLDKLVKEKVAKIVYISCDYKTLARDVKYLYENKYQISSIYPIDMFPNTKHVECVCLLEYSSNK